jgi:hypothetical protein
MFRIIGLTVASLTSIRRFDMVGRRTHATIKDVEMTTCVWFKVEMLCILLNVPILETEGDTKKPTKH